MKPPTPHRLSLASTGLAVFILSVLCPGWSHAAPPFPEFIDPNPSPGNQFGATVVALSTGNVVITAPYDDAGGEDAGAVYLFNGATGALISTLRGSTPGDNVGFGGVTAVGNGNYVVGSINWSNPNTVLGTAVYAGASTWCSGVTGRNGTVSDTNSLVGSHEFDQVGGSVTVLSNGNYVVRSLYWDNGDVFDAGAVTWGSSLGGVVGQINSENSLVGSSANDKLGNYSPGDVVLLSNGNYVVSSPGWDNGSMTNAGAATWCSGVIPPTTGVISSSNSLVGTPASGTVGGVTALTNGNYVVAGTHLYMEEDVEREAGAVTWAHGGTGRTGIITTSNSLISYDGGWIWVTALTNGNYVVTDAAWSNPTSLDPWQQGAVTWCSGTAVRSGVISISNSLVGATPIDRVGSSVTALSNGNYVVHSPEWDNEAMVDAGAVTWCSGTGATSGEVSSVNSLVGSPAAGIVGNDLEVGSVTALSNGHYVVSTPGWNNGTVTAAGAVTWCNGHTGRSGVVTTSNSLFGSTANDEVGSGGVTELSNGNYVVVSSGWNNGSLVGAGAVTWCSGTSTTNEQVSTANSLHGDKAGDQVGVSGVTALSNGNYVVSSAAWDYVTPFQAVSDVGAVTLCSGTESTSSAVNVSNSLFGATANDGVGTSVTALSNGNYVVSSPNWDNGGVVNAGAVTWRSGTSGVPGPVTSSNSLVGSTAQDQLGLNYFYSSSITALSNGNYLVLSAEWDNSGLQNAGALTWGSGSVGVTGPITSSNSYIGSASNGTVSGLALDHVNQTYIVGFYRPNASDKALLGSQVDGGVPPNLVPAVTAISPSSGNIAGGTIVTITGANFAVGASVTIGGTAATNVTVVNSATIICTTPARPAGSASVLVTTTLGTNAANTLYTYMAAPTVTAVSPAIGSIAGGTSVTITGTNLAGAPGVTFGGTAATSVVVVNSTTITCITPAHTAGAVSVLVTTGGGTNASNALFTYVIPAPDIAVAQSGPLTDGVGSVSFGSLPAGSSSGPLTFTITNPGTAELADLAVSKSGLHAADFTVSALSATSIPVGSGTATFTVTFTPSSGGALSAALHIASNVVGAKSSFDITLSGSGTVAGKAAQVIAFTPPAKPFLAESPLTLTASASSGLPVTFSLVSGPATLAGNVLTFTAKGAVKVRAIQAGNDSYLPAIPVDRTITAAANPTSLTLTNLSQTYTGTPRPIAVLGTGGAVEVTYKVGLNFVPDAPINVGSYAVKAVAGTTTKTGTLVITKAPLFVQPDDQRKLIGQENPVLGFSYSGFLGSDNAANSVSKAPVIATTAKAASPGGLYPITSSGGTSANYLFIYMKGTMKIETFAASYEAMLMAGDPRRPAAKLELTVAATSKTFSAKLTTPTETAALSLPGTLTIDTLTETATGTATVKKGANTYLVTVTLPLTGDFMAEAKLNGAVLGDATDGRKLLILAKGQTLSYIGAHSALLAPAAAAAGVPAGAGWAVATIDAKGLLKLVGKLADGSGLTASLAADGGSNPGYRLFLQPYTPARTGAFIAGAFALKPHPDLPGRRIVAYEDAADLTWVKAPRLLDTSYRAGFGPVDTRFTLDPWLPPAPAKTGVPAITLTQRLGLTANQFTAQHSDISSASFDDLPETLGLNATTNVVSVIAPVTTPANTTKWKVTLTPATGAFTGSFELTDAGKKRLVPFAGMMRQPPSTDPSGLIGDGNFQLPALTPAPNNEILSGEIGFER